MIELDKEMEREGYVFSPPGSIEVTDQSVEAQLCASYRCEKCGRMGLRYRPFVEHHRQIYRAFAECPDCGWAIEV